MKDFERSERRGCLADAKERASERTSYRLEDSGGRAWVLHGSVPLPNFCSVIDKMNKARSNSKHEECTVDIGEMGVCTVLMVQPRAFSKGSVV